MDSPQKAEELVKETGCDGIMIGRAVRGNPWLFSRILHYQETGEVLPKPGIEEIREMMNHINSYPRKKWNGQAPIDLFIKIYGQETANLLGLEKIPSDSITLTPALFKR